VAGFNINLVVISGNLTRDPEFRSLPNGTPVCELGIAVNDRIKDETGNWTDRPNYFDVTVWGGMGEWAARSLRKGAGLTVEGRLRYESWEKDGQTRSKVKIVANSLVPRDGQSGGQGQDQGGGGEFRAQRTDVPVNTDDFAAAPVGGGSSPAAEDDIPF
jgi:single-strand DNA-binding protein